MLKVLSKADFSNGEILVVLSLIQFKDNMVSNEKYQGNVIDFPPPPASQGAPYA